MKCKDLTVWEEHQFWLKILDDHAHFVYDYLSSNEKVFIKQAKSFIQQFQHLREKLQSLDPHRSADHPMLIKFAQEADFAASEYYGFERRIQHLRMANQINIQFTPTYFNGTLGENREYLRLLQWYQLGKTPPPLPLNALLNLWLEDQAGHALLLDEGMDVTEMEVRKKARQLAETFQSYLLRNEQWKNFYDTPHSISPAERFFVRRVIQSVLSFTQLVQEVVKRHQHKAILNRLTLRFLKHHFPEACYFLHKLCHFLPEEEARQIPKCQLVPPYFDELSDY